MRVLLLLSTLFITHAAYSITLTEDQFIADKWSDIKSVDSILSSELMFDDEKTSTLLYKVTFKGTLLIEEDCSEAPTPSGDACAIEEVNTTECYFMVYDKVDETLTDTVYLCSADTEEVIEDLYPVYLYED